MSQLSGRNNGRTDCQALGISNVNEPWFAILQEALDHWNRRDNKDDERYGRDSTLSHGKKN